jgi:hypothetical protein
MSEMYDMRALSSSVILYFAANMLLLAIWR